MEPSHAKKRIIVCCDGTWKDSDGDVQVASNVTRLAHAIRSTGLDNSVNPPKPIPQVVYYQNGVGTGTHSSYTRLVGGATGQGIGHNIREAYSFICHNYHAGDEIFLIGFSRGAFTARSVSSLIKGVGLLTPAGLRYLTPIFEDWKYQGKKAFKSKYKKPWPDRPPVYTPEYQRKLLELELAIPNIPIKCIAVWDTVGALGIPKIAFLPQSPAHKFYSFVDTRIEPIVEYAFQALALDEHRRSYHPTIWEKPASQTFPRVLKQTWFPGVHSDVGGSYDDADLANLTLAWMATQLEPLLSLDYELITREVRLAKEFHEERHEPIREWGLGKIHNSMSLVFRLLGSQVRTPSEYCEIDRLTRKYTGRRLENTCETIHSSVRIRMGRAGLGYDDRGDYESSALEGWTMHGVETNPDTPIAQSLPGAVGQMTNVTWKKTVQTKDSKGKVENVVLEMPEDTMQGLERKLLNLWPDLAKDFDCLKPRRHKLEIVKAATFPSAKKEPVKLASAIPERIKSLTRSKRSGSESENESLKDSIRKSQDSAIASPGSNGPRALELTEMKADIEQSQSVDLETLEKEGHTTIVEKLAMRHRKETY